MHVRAARLRSRTIAVAIIALACVAGGSAHAQAPLVTEVVVEGTWRVSADVVRDAVKDVLRPGLELTRECIAAAEKKIMELRYYDRVTISHRVVPEGLQVIISVVEKQLIEKVLFVGNTVLSDEDLVGVVKSKIGGFANPTLAERDAERIDDAYEKAGYIAQVTRADIDNFGVLTFVIEEVRIEAIEITGLKRTKEWVVRRQIDLKPGELYNDRRIVENRNRIMRDLQIFKTVEVALPPGKLDPVKGVIVQFKIEEARTAQASAALAYSSLDDLVLMLSLQENNFRGEGERATAHLELFGRTSYDLTYVEPYFDTRGTSIEVSLFDTERRRQFVGGMSISTANDEFDENRSGGSIRVSRPLDAKKRSRASIRFRTETVSSSFFQGARTLPALSTGGAYAAASGRGSADDPPDNPGLLPDVPEPGDMIGPVTVAAPLHPGGRLTSVTLGYSNDLRDSFSNPTCGRFTTVNAEFAGSILGGDSEFQKVQFETRRYFPVRSGKDVVALRLLVGTTFGDLPLFESYNVGGANSLRGYEQDRFRGKRMLLGSVEYRHPISDSLTLVGFVDAGDAYGGQFPTVVPGFWVPSEDQSFDAHVGVGAGLRVDTPLGPLRLDFGWGDDGSEAHFAFGHSF